MIKNQEGMSQSDGASGRLFFFSLLDSIEKKNIGWKHGRGSRQNLSGQGFFFFFFSLRPRVCVWQIGYEYLVSAHG